MCNVAYNVLAEGRDKDELLELADRLNTPPWEKIPDRSRGTEALMGLFGPGGLAPPR